MSEIQMKRSVCPSCKGTVRIAGAKFLENNTKARNEFKSEVFDHNLNVEEMTLSKYQEVEYPFCDCDLTLD